MEIKAVKFRDEGFYTQPFVLGGEEGVDKYDKNIRYKGSMQNYLIDTGDEVILVDTGYAAELPVEVPNENSLNFVGRKTQAYDTDSIRERDHADRRADTNIYR